MCSIKHLLLIAGCSFALSITCLTMVMVYMSMWDWENPTSFSKEANSELSITELPEQEGFYPDPLHSYWNKYEEDQAAVPTSTESYDLESPGMKQWMETRLPQEDKSPKNKFAIKMAAYLKTSTSTASPVSVELPKTLSSENITNPEVKDISPFNNYDFEIVTISPLMKRVLEENIEAYEDQRNNNDAIDDEEPSREEYLYSILKAHKLLPPGYPQNSFGYLRSENDVDEDENNDENNDIDDSSSTSAGTKKDVDSLENLYDYTPDEHIDITKAISPLDNLEPESEEETDDSVDRDAQKSLLLAALISALEKATTKEEASPLPCSSNMNKASPGKNTNKDMEIHISRMDFEKDDDEDINNDETDPDGISEATKILISRVATLELLGELYSCLFYLIICVCALLVVFICIVVLANMAVKHFESDLLEIINKEPKMKKNNPTSGDDKV